MDNEREYINNFHGLELYPGFEEGTRDNENGIYFLATYYFLKHINGDFRHADIAQFQIIVENITSYDKGGNKIKGLYDRGAGESLWKDKDSIRTISHDNLTAISSFSKMFENEGLGYHKHIAKHGRGHFWRFDNVYPEKPRWSRMMLPRDIIFWSRNDDRLWAKMMIFWTVIECIYSCSRKYDYRPQLIERIIGFFKTGKFEKHTYKGYATSGKLLSFVRLYTLKDTLIGKIGWKICTWFVRRYFNEGWLSIFKIYYKNSEHPIRKIIEKIYKDNKNIF